MSHIDHVVFAVNDLDAAARALWDEFGLEAQPGGTHSGAGTANLLVPVGNKQYIELLAVIDPESKHPIVPFLLAHLVDGDRLLQVAIDPGDIDTTVERFGGVSIDVDRVAPDGRTCGFRLTGLEAAFGNELLPFFVGCLYGCEWRCGFRPPAHRASVSGVSAVEIGADAGRLREQLGEIDVPITCVDGRPGVAALTLLVDDSEATLRV